MSAPTITRAAGAARSWNQRRANRRALAKFGEFWRALQHVGDVLAEAEKAAKAADDGTGGAVAGSGTGRSPPASEVRSAVKGCRSSLRIVSAQAKRFEPELIVKDWRR